MNTNTTKPNDLAKAIEKEQICPIIRDFMQQHLQHPINTYKRIARMVASESSDGHLRFFYSLRGYAPEEILRLQQSGWNVELDDIVFREGQAAFGAMVHPLDTALTTVERKRMEEVRIQHQNQKKANLIPKVVELP